MDRSGARVRARARVTGFDHVSVTTTDLDASVAFYGDLLGLPVSETGESDGDELDRMMGREGVRFRWADIDLGGGTVLELLQFIRPEGAPFSKTLWDPGAGHIGLRVDDIGAVHDRLVAAGVRVISGPVRLTEEGSWYGVEVLYAVDPDGTWVELVQRPEAITVVHGDEDAAIEVTEGA